eukprot:scaffold340_cov256-Pinguiococcus_pyrenoidosus.AAC.2
MTESRASPYFKLFFHRSSNHFSLAKSVAVAFWVSAQKAPKLRLRLGSSTTRFGALFGGFDFKDVASPSVLLLVPLRAHSPARRAGSGGIRAAAAGGRLR